jgi:hypothetical protein
MAAFEKQKKNKRNQIKFRKMKKAILSLPIDMMTNSCSISNLNSPEGKYSWSSEVNGKSYSWSGNYPDFTNPSSMGLSTYTDLELALYLPIKLNNVPFSFIVNFKNIPTAGIYTFDQNNSTIENACLMIIDNLSSISTNPGSSIKVTIPYIPSNTYMNTKGANPGSIKGTFSGVMYGIDPKNVTGPLIRYEITNGKYEAIVLS